MSRGTHKNLTVSLSNLGPQVLNAGYFHFGRAMEFRYEVHLHHLIFVEHGHLKAQTSTGPISATDSDFLCFRPSLDMIYRVTAETRFYQAAVQFLPPPNHLLTPELPEVGLLPVQTATGNSKGDFLRLFETICIELPQTGSRHHFRVQTAIWKMLALVAAACDSSSTSPVASPLDAWDHAHLRVASIEGGAFAPGAMAKELGVSERHFQRVFKQRFGMSPSICRMKARLAEAVTRLSETDEPIKSISYDLGFDGAKGLTDSLKKHLGLTASQIRMNLQAPSTNLSEATTQNLFLINRHILPPSVPLKLFLSRVTVSEREL